MKVYVVTEYSISDAVYFRGVFSTEDKAKKRIENRKKKSKYADIDFVEYELDEELGP